MPFGLFRESDHPRGPGGKFSSKGGGGGESSQTAQPKQESNPKAPGSRPKVVPGREKVAKPAARGKRSDPSIAGVKKSDFDKQKFYADPSKKGWENRALKNTGKIGKARSAAVKQMLKHPGDYVSGKYDWLWAEGTANTDPRGDRPAKNAPNARQASIQSRKDVVSAKHRELGMKAAAESAKKHPSKSRLKKLQAKQMKLGKEAKKLDAQELTMKAKAAQKAAKASGDLKQRVNANTASQKAIGARLQVEQGKKHPNGFTVSRLNRQSAKLAKQTKKLNRKASKPAVKRAKAKTKAAKKAVR